MNPLQISPRSFPTPRFTPTAPGLSNGHAERLAAGRAASAAERAAGSGEGDMLTTPNPYDSFPPSATGADFPMKGAESTPEPPEPQGPRSIENDQRFKNGLRVSFDNDKRVRVGNVKPKKIKTFFKPHFKPQLFY